MSDCMRAAKHGGVCRRRTSSIANYFFPCWQHKGQPLAALDLYWGKIL